MNRKKYTSAKELKAAVDAYFASISYQKPVIIESPTGEIDEHGHVKVVRRMLREGECNEGKPVTVTAWFEKPQLAGLCLRLGITKETWRQYEKDQKLAPVVVYAKLKMEQYWAGRLDGKGAHGARFVLTNNFGWNDVWKDKQELELGEQTRKDVLGPELSLQEKLDAIERAVKSYAADESTEH